MGFGKEQRLGGSPGHFASQLEHDDRSTIDGVPLHRVESASGRIEGNTYRDLSLAPKAGGRSRGNNSEADRLRLRRKPSDVLSNYEP